MNALVFWSLVDKSGGECWTFRGDGYVVRGGRMTVRVNGLNMTVQRASWVLTHGREPNGWVKNSCKNKRCVNPAHLFVPGERETNLERAAYTRGYQAGLRRAARAGG